MDWLLRRVRFLDIFFFNLFFSIQVDNVHSILWYAIHTGIMTSTVDMREDTGGRPVQKAKVNCNFIQGGKIYFLVEILVICISMYNL